MRRGGHRWLALTVAVGAAGLSAASAQADFGPCSTPEANTTCETLTVPLDRSGHVPGVVHLAVMRRAASEQPSRGTVIALAGGPGQASNPLLDQLADALAPLVADRDLVVFDARGTGASDALSCPSLDAAETRAETDRATTDCANSIGPARAFYTSRDNAEDIDAVRQSLGLGSVSLYGVSYGSYTALTYARLHPDHVSSLVLDSVPGPGGVDPLDRATYPAYRRVLRDVCSGDCRGITSDPVGVLAKVIARVRRHPARTRIYTSSGRRISTRIGVGTLRAMLAGGDFDPTVRTDLPSSLVAASHGDTAPLGRVLLREATEGGSRFEPRASGPAFDTPLFFATACEEAPMPWARGAPLTDRPAALSGALAGVPASVYAPFARSDEANDGLARQCLPWPDGSPSSPAVGGTPANVPTLVLDGADDTRTPVATATATAALFPQAQVVVVPQTGHSVVGTDLTGCAAAALGAFAAGGVASPCPHKRLLFPPTPVPPRSLRNVSAPHALRSKRGRTVLAAGLTLNDTLRQAIAHEIFAGSGGGGGLRGGHFRASLSGRTLVIHLTRLQYVPGVRLSGVAKVPPTGSATATLHVRGGAAAHGTLSFVGHRVHGRLAGRSVRANLTSAAAAAPALPSWAALRSVGRWAEPEPASLRP